MLVENQTHETNNEFKNRVFEFKLSHPAIYKYIFNEGKIDGFNQAVSLMKGIEDTAMGIKGDNND